MIYFFPNLVHWVLAAACGTFSGGMWDLVPWPRIEPGPPELEPGVLATGPPGKSQNDTILKEQNIPKVKILHHFC